jgi:FkbM family methyltransferase
MAILALKLRAVREIVAHFANPFLVILMRFGFLRLPFFLYRIRNADVQVAMLARPSSASMSDLFVLRELFIEQTYRELLPLLPDRPVSVLDIGANLGSFTIWLNQRHGIARAVCFEPEPVSFQLCRFNLFNNGLTAATALPCAAGGIGRTIQLGVGSERPGGVSIYDKAEGSVVDVEVVAMADWLAANPGEWDLLKLDCEGAEWEILDTVPKDFFSRFRVIVAEAHRDSTGKHQIEDFHGMMKERGFRTIRWDAQSHGVYVGVRDQNG